MMNTGNEINYTDEFWKFYMKSPIPDIKLGHNIEPETITCIIYINDEPFLCFLEEMKVYKEMIYYKLPYQKNARFKLQEIPSIKFRFLEIREPLYNGFFKINCEME